MKKIILTACIASITLTGILCNIKKTLAKETNTTTTPTTLKNIEQLSFSESHDISMCIEGRGYCYINGKPQTGLKLKD
ncbi:hypothetical protein [Butyricimonas synergistica]|uniref:hypothetical protein n=1 Tax=Butyricimonas synergistica TaxID=544644 RepID=UPI0012DECD78|nr:hypothetical protein [Butyricimonas synergistica]